VSPAIIIIIIKYIYTAQDWEEAANALGISYKWNRNVLSLFLNVASVMWHVPQPEMLTRPDITRPRPNHRGRGRKVYWLTTVVIM